MRTEFRPMLAIVDLPINHTDFDRLELTTVSGGASTFFLPSTRSQTVN